jgi:hypothetical protein
MAPPRPDGDGMSHQKANEDLLAEVGRRLNQEQWEVQRR